METKNLILRDINWHLDQQYLHYISREMYGTLLPVPFGAMGRVRQHLGSCASVFAVDLKCPQGQALAGPLSMIAIIIVDENGLLFISSKDVESHQYEFEVLGPIQKELGEYESPDLEGVSHERVLSFLKKATPQECWQ